MGRTMVFAATLVVIGCGAPARRHDDGLPSTDAGPSAASMADASPSVASAAPSNDTPDGTQAASAPPPATDAGADARASNGSAAGSPLPPPAGTAPCKPGGTKDPRAAALACYATRVKPALVALSKSPTVSMYRFGDGRYLGSVLAIAPNAYAITKTKGRPTVAFPGTVALGDPSTIDPARSFHVVTIALRRNDMPADGHTELMFYLDDKTLETVLVVRALLG